MCLGPRGRQQTVAARWVSVERRDSSMAIGDKIEHAGEEAAGKIKEGVGNATDNESLKAEGQGDQASANVKQAGDKAKDAAGKLLGD
jgi:uncharacterized protein YjbJ (UPF0337 family)